MRIEPLWPLALLVAISISFSCSGSQNTERMDYPIPGKKVQPAPQVRLTKPGLIKRAELVAILNQGPQKFISQVLTRPFVKQNRFVGFEILALFPNDPRFRNAAVKPGDVILTVNGFRLERPKQFMAAWSKMKGVKSIQIKLLRNKRLHTIVYQIVDQ